MHVRRYRHSDLDATARIWASAREAAFPYLERHHDLEEVRAYLRDIHAHDAQIWVAERLGRVVGFLSIRGNRIANLFVTPNQQRTGVGRMLLGQAMRLSPRALSLHTFERNHAARAFYGQHGFVERGRVPNLEGTEPGIELLYRRTNPRRSSDPRRAHDPASNGRMEGVTE